MTRDLFFEWLLRFNEYIATSAGRQALLLVDNAAVHGNTESLPVLSNVRVYFLPKLTTSILQPLDGGVIASVKKQYQRKQIERGVDLIDAGVTGDIYKIDMKMAIEWIYDIWMGLDPVTIKNCWVKTNIIG